MQNVFSVLLTILKKHPVIKLLIIKRSKYNKMTIPHKYMMAFLAEKTKFNILTWTTQEG